MVARTIILTVFFFFFPRHALPVAGTLRSHGKKGRKKDRQTERKKGRMKERKEGRKEERKKGRKEGRKKGRKKPTNETKTMNAAGVQQCPMADVPAARQGNTGHSVLQHSLAS